METGDSIRTGAPGKDEVAKLILAAHATIAAHAVELSELDSAIGDADHGINMQRGFEALKAEVEALSAMPLPEALKAAGMKLVMTVGGASGPLFGTLLMTLGRELSLEQTGAAGRAAFNAAFLKAVESVAARGKAARGQKTMLDVLYPVAEALNAGYSPAAVARFAHEAASATIPVMATRGRASFLGVRSIGHMDPGSRSSALLAGVAAEWFEGIK